MHFSLVSHSSLVLIIHLHVTATNSTFRSIFRQCAQSWVEYFWRCWDLVDRSVLPFHHIDSYCTLSSSWKARVNFIIKEVRDFPRKSKHCKIQMFLRCRGFEAETKTSVDRTGNGENGMNGDVTIQVQMGDRRRMHLNNSLSSVFRNSTGGVLWKPNQCREAWTRPNPHFSGFNSQSSARHTKNHCQQQKRERGKQIPVQPEDDLEPGLLLQSVLGV